MKSLLLMVFLGCIQNLGAQEFDTANLKLQFKIKLIEYAEIHSPKDIEYFFNEMPIELISLESKGFSKHMVFFEVPINAENTRPHIFMFNYNFVIGYNKLNGILYRLKGFKQNEFHVLFSQLHYPFNVEDTVDLQENLCSRKKFLKAYSIKSLDLACLYKSLKQNKIPTPCLRQVRKFYEQFEPW